MKVKWLYECGQLVEEVPEVDSCSCGLNCEGRPLPESDAEWLLISYWMGWRLEWREIYDRGDYPAVEWYDPREEGITGWWTDEGLGHYCCDSTWASAWQIIMRDHGEPA